MAYMAANCAKLSKGITLMITKMKSVSHSSAPKACCSTFMLKCLFCNQNRNLGFKVSIFFRRTTKICEKTFFVNSFHGWNRAEAVKWWIASGPWNCILISLSYRPEKLGTLENNVPTRSEFLFLWLFALHAACCSCFADCQLTYRNSLYFKLPGWSWYEKG